MLNQYALDRYRRGDTDQPGNLFFRPARCRLMTGPFIAFLVMLMGSRNFVSKKVIAPLNATTRHMLDVSAGEYLTQIPIDEPAKPAN